MDAAARGWFLALMDLPLSPRIRATGAIILDFIDSLAM
jgi:hypothetical protein